MTNLNVAEDSVHLELTDERIFKYPFMFVQQVGQGGWRPNEEEAAGLREYLARGGFLMVDDFPRFPRLGGIRSRDSDRAARPRDCRDSA